MHSIARMRRASRAARVIACLAGALALAGCSKGPLGVDPSYTTPEGTPSADARLILFPDAQIVITTWVDKPDNSTGEGIGGTWNPASPTNPDGDVYVSSVVLHQADPNMIRGMILDQTPASGFQIMRRETNGGLRALLDHPISPARKWLETHSEIYEFDDPKPSGYAPPTYFGRGYIDGQIAEASPVTNAAEMTTPDVAGIHYTASRLPTDSLFTISWDPVPAAAGYWIEVYDWTPGASTIERRLTGTVAPVSPSSTLDFFLGYFPSGTTSYTIGDPAPLLLAFRKNEFRMSRLYSVRIAAVDDLGRLIGLTFGDQPGDAIVGGGIEPGTIEVSPRGAVLVQPKK